MKFNSHALHSALYLIYYLVSKFDGMIYWPSLLLTLSILFFYLFICLFLLFLREQILFFGTIAIIFFIWFNIFRNKGWSWMDLYLCKSSILIFRSIINNMIVLLFMLSIVVIWWSWLNFLKCWCGITAIIFWVGSYYWLLIFVINQVVFL